MQVAKKRKGHKSSTKCPRVDERSDEITSTSGVDDSTVNIPSSGITSAFPGTAVREVEKFLPLRREHRSVVWQWYLNKSKMRRHQGQAFLCPWYRARPSYGTVDVLNER
jgi:hypothetical protein